VADPTVPDGEAKIFLDGAMLPELADLAVPDLGAWVGARHTRDLLHVETLDRYAADVEAEDYPRWRDGHADHWTADQLAWADHVRDDVADGRAWRRLHLLRTPLTEALQYELDRPYRLCAGAGEQIRILDLVEHPEVEGMLRLGDFWAVDGIHVARSHYDADGRMLGVTAAAAETAAAYVVLAESAWQMGTDLHEWWAAHPQYRRGARAA
jgi:hypothetical protein